MNKLALREIGNRLMPAPTPAGRNLNLVEQVVAQSGCRTTTGYDINLPTVRSRHRYSWWGDFVNYEVIWRYAEFGSQQMERIWHLERE